MQFNISKNMHGTIFDVIIIGAGPGAMGALKYLDKDRKACIVSDNLGHFVYNSIKTHKRIDGLFFAEGKNPKVLLKEYSNLVETSGVNFIFDQITKVEKENDYFIVKGKRNYHSKTVLVATGNISKDFLGISKYTNVHSLAGDFDSKKLCKKQAVVIGGRNSGSTAAIYLSKHCSEVYLLEKEQTLPAKEKYRIAVEKANNITVLTGVKKIVVSETKNNRIISLLITRGSNEIKISSDYYFQYTGLSPNTKLVEGICELDNKGYIITNTRNETSCEGLYAAGDVTGKLSQIVVAHGDGANAIYWLQKKI